MSISSDNLGDLLTHEDWDAIVWGGIADEIESGPYGEVAKIFYIADGIPGADSYDVKPMVPPELPAARPDAYSDPNPSRSKYLATRSIAYTHYLNYDYLSVDELMAMIRRGEIETWVRELIKLPLAHVCQSCATALDAIHSSSGALIVSADSGSSTEALAATHTLLDGSTTYDNSLAVSLTSDQVAAMYETLAEEVNANNVPTYPTPRVVWAGTSQRRELLQALMSEVSSSALQINVNRGLQPAIISNLTSTDWGMCVGPRPGGPTIAYAGAYTEAELPPILRGLGVAPTSGRPSVSYPIWNPLQQKLMVSYGVKYAIGAAQRNGWIAST